MIKKEALNVVFILLILIIFIMSIMILPTVSALSSFHADANIETLTLQDKSFNSINLISIDNRVQQAIHNQLNVPVIITVDSPDWLQQQLVEKEELPWWGLFMNYDMEETSTIDRYSVLTGMLTPEGFNKIISLPGIINIELDEPVRVMLSESIPLIGADKVHNISVNSTPITGNRVSSCVLDTGIDYTHEALGSTDCTTNAAINGTIENVSIESSHPYHNNTVVSFSLEKPGYDSIAVYFKNVSLETNFDYIVLRDRAGTIYQNITGVYSQFYSVPVPGDFVNISLYSDLYHDDFGFNITKVRDTSIWTNCNRMIGGYDFVNTDDDPVDDHGHGSHVSGIIASTNATYKGVAPGSSIFHGKVLGSNGVGSFSNILKAIDLCTRDRNLYNIKVISMSLGTSGSTMFGDHCDDYYPALSRGVNDAYANGLTIVAASGNSGSSTLISSPACLANVTAIGSTTKSDYISGFSNSNSLVRLLAPGSFIRSVQHEGSFSYKSGTSMATPHAAGAVALIQQYVKAKLGYYMSPDNVIDILLRTGKSITDSRNNVVQSRINVYNAIQSIPYLNDNILIHKRSGNNVSFHVTPTTTTNITRCITASTYSFYINTSRCPQFNQTANISFYDKNIINPLVYVDGAPCTTCNVSKRDNRVIVEVESFSNVSIVSGCGKINESGTIVGPMHDNNGTCFTIAHDANSTINITCSSNTIIDGSFFGSAFSFNQDSNIQLSNCTISEFANGINIMNSSTITLKNITITNNSVGILVHNYSSDIIFNAIGSSTNDKTIIHTDSLSTIITNTTLYGLTIKHINGNSLLSELSYNDPISISSSLLLKSVIFLTPTTIKTIIDNLNKSAKLSFYNVSGSSLVPLVDSNHNGTFEDCPSELCTNLSFSRSIFSFYVQHFAMFSYASGHTYIAPVDTFTRNFTATASISGVLTDGTTSRHGQKITYSRPLYGDRLELFGLFNESDVDMSSLRILVSTNKTVAIMDDVAGIEEKQTLWIDNTNHGGGIIVCPHASTLNEIVPSCANNTIIESPYPSTKNGITVSLDETSYKVANLSHSGIGNLAFIPKCGLKMNDSLSLKVPLNSSGTCLFVDSSDITIDCNNNSITGTGTGAGIQLQNVTNVTIKDCFIYGFSYGVLLNDSSNNYVLQNVLSENTQGLEIYGSSTQNTILYNVFKDNTYNTDSHGNNIFSENSTGVYIGNSWDDIDSVQIVDSNADGYGDSGTGYPYNATSSAKVTGTILDYGPSTSLRCGLSLTKNTILSYNLSSSKNSCFTVVEPDVTVDCNGYSITGNNKGHAIIANATGVIIKNCDFINFSTGVMAQYESASILNSTFEQNNVSVMIVDSGEHEISNNSFTKGDIQVYGNNTSDNSISDNMFLSGDKGIFLDNDESSFIGRNFFFLNFSLHIMHSSHINITSNTIKDGVYGLYMLDTNRSVINENTIFGNMIGLSVINSYNNTAFKNIFLNNQLHANSSHYSNYFYINVSGELTGNQWSDTALLHIIDTTYDKKGDTGTQYPYSKANGGNVDGFVVDKAPLLTTVKAYFHPTDSFTKSLIANGSRNGSLANGSAYGSNQNITFLDSSGKRYFKIPVYFKSSYVDLSPIKVSKNNTAIVIDKGDAKGIGVKKTVFLPNTNDQNGIFVCLNATSLAQTEITSCGGTGSPLLFNGPFPQTISGVRVVIDGPDYQIENLSHSGVSQIAIPSLQELEEENITQPSSTPPSGGGSGGGGGSSMPLCNEQWECSNWEECSFLGRQFRRCIDNNACGTTDSKPETLRDCTAPTRCNNGIRDINELGVDCGGICPPCQEEKPSVAETVSEPTPPKPEPKPVQTPKQQVQQTLEQISTAVHVEDIIDQDEDWSPSRIALYSIMFILALLIGATLVFWKHIPSTITGKETIEWKRKEKKWKH